MKRPLAVFCFTWYAVQLVGTRLPQSGLLAAAVSFFISFIIIIAFFGNRSKRAFYTLVVLLTAAAAASLWQGVYRVQTEKISAKWANRTETVRCVVQKSRTAGTGSMVQFKLPDGRREILTAAWLPISCEEKDVLTATLEFRPASGNQQAQGSRLAAEYAQQKGAVLQIESNADETTHTFARLQKNFSGILQAKISGAPGKAAAAICTGDKTALTDSLYRDYQRAGIGHLLAVSGLHLSVVCGSLLVVFPRGRPWLRFAAGVLLTVCYAAFTGSSPSVLRAALMLLIALAAPAVCRSADTVTSLGFAAFCLTIFNPMAAADPALLFSLSSTAGVLAAHEWYLMRQMERKSTNLLQKLARRALSLAIAGIGAAVFTLPAVMLTGGYMSLWSVPAGILTIPILPVLLGSGLLGALAQILNLKMLASALLAVCGAVGRYINAVAQGFSNIEFGGGYLTGGYLLTVLAVLLAGAAIAVTLAKNQKRFLAVIGAVALFSVLLGSAFGAKTVKVVLIGTANAPSVIIAKGSEAAVLWKGGSNTARLEECLERLNLHSIVLLCDFSGKRSASPQFRYYVPQAYCKITQSVTTGVTFEPFDDIILCVERQSGGDVCLIDAKGVTLCYTTGVPSLEKQIVSVLLTGEKLPLGVRAEWLLTTSPKAAKAGESIAQEMSCVSGICAFVRPGVSYKIMEVNTDGSA